MADAFIDVTVETDEQTIADAAIEALRLKWVGWEPNEGDLEVVMVESLSPMAADAAEVASRVPSAVFRTILERLHGLSYTVGKKATTTVRFTMVDALPHVIPAGTEIDVDGYAFTVNVDVATAALNVPGVAVTAAVEGVEANGLVGTTVVMITSLAFVASVATEATTAGGLDEETPEAFQSRGSRELELMARTLVTARDYELLALSQAAVGRVVVITDPATRTVTSVPSTAIGGILPQTEKDALSALYAENRLSTWVVTIADATTTVIAVTYSVKPYPGFVAADLLTRINSALDLFLDPGNWGRSGGGYGDVTQNSWLLEPRVRKNKIIDLIGDVEGVDYVSDVTLSAPAGTLQANGDWLMPGTVPLADAGVLTGSVV